jgi:5-methylthioadenosine/S-adenosylhomocysteine deaminase
LQAATLGAARALGMDARIGSIEAGKEADLTAFDMSAIETTPIYDPVSHLLYACGRESVSDVWVAGERVVRKRQLAHTDGNAPDGALSPLIGAWQNLSRQFLKSPSGNQANVSEP